MGSTLVNSWITVIGIIVTVGSIWLTYILGAKSATERRIQDVVSRFSELYLREKRGRGLGSLMLFLRAGALSLTGRDMKESARRIMAAHGTNPLDDPHLSDKRILQSARDRGIDLDNLASRITFILDDSGYFESPEEQSQAGSTSDQ